MYQGSSVRIFCDNLELLTDRSPNNEVSLNSKQPNYETTWLSINRGCVLFYYIVDCFKLTSHFGLRRALRFSSFREKHGRIVYYFENSDLHQFLTKLGGPKTTMALQEMERLLVPLGTPGSKHSRSY